MPHLDPAALLPAALDLASTGVPVLPLRAGKMPVRQLPRLRAATRAAAGRT